ncbi:SPOR domain-containing protein [Massilia sp. ST3]|uniref:SPOR domain-containing protein n=1 Tax=Massilia sp. ST3 TaxID=2824903 RepID=UPI001B837F57|nr:SPOR domain-containing protein [Massilia sp. ST3]MBQ5946932.1 SPOR domain-containing protein [Massilia sp. ST3]
MGLFSFGNKNKQETVRDSGHFVKDDDAAIGERARSKRASHAGEGARRGRGPDPILPEKKRARRRLVGAIALALAAAVGLPMLLDSEPKPLAGDIAIHIPSKEKAAPLPVPAEPASTAPVSASESVDSDEEIVDVPSDTPPAAPSAPKAAPASVEPPPVRTVETAKPDAPKPEPKPEAVKPEPARKPEPEKREPEKKPAKQAEPKTAEKAEKPRADESARAMAILEDKPVVKAEGPAPRYVVQVAALASQEKAAELQSRLRAAGVSSFTQKSGDLIRVRVGPFSKEEAEKVRAKLGSIGLSGTMVPL